MRRNHTMLLATLPAFALLACAAIALFARSRVYQAGDLTVKRQGTGVFNWLDGHSHAAFSRPLVLLPTCNLSLATNEDSSISRRQGIQLIQLVQWTAIQSYTLLPVPVLGSQFVSLAKWSEIASKLEARPNARPWLLFVGGDSIVPSLHASVEKQITRKLSGCDVVLDSKSINSSTENPSASIASASAVLAFKTAEAVDFAHNMVEQLASKSVSKPALMDQMGEQYVLRELIEAHGATICSAPPNTLGVPLPDGEANPEQVASAVTVQTGNCGACAKTEASNAEQICNDRMYHLTHAASVQYASIFKSEG